MKADALFLPERVSFLYPFYLAGVAALRGWYKAWNVGRRKMLRAKRERRELLRLCEMDDRELADIGLSRSDLSRVCSRPSRQERRVQDAIALGVALGLRYPGQATPRESVS